MMGHPEAFLWPGHAPASLPIHHFLAQGQDSLLFPYNLAPAFHYIKLCCVHELWRYIL